MTLPSSGTLSLSDLQTEFTGSNPISMSEYYKSGGNGYVPSTVAEAVKLPVLETVLLYEVKVA